MNSLFSVFDPSTRITGSLSLNWLAITSVLLLPSGFWLKRRKGESFVKKRVLRVAQEVKTNSKLSAPRSTPIVLSATLALVISRNFFGLAPYVFTSSSHLSYTLVLAASSWVGYSFYTLVVNPSNFLAHLVPAGTPPLLIPFIVLIELIRRVIRPLTLAVRLAANIVAGHLLLVLVRRPMASLNRARITVAIIGVIRLIVLETAVAFIQGYVFVRLSSLYVGEVNADNL